MAKTENSKLGFLTKKDQNKSKKYDIQKMKNKNARCAQLALPDCQAPVMSAANQISKWSVGSV